VDELEKAHGFNHIANGQWHAQRAPMYTMGARPPPITLAWQVRGRTCMHACMHASMDACMHASMVQYPTRLHTTPPVKRFGFEGAR
jgi:hypothetical protein